MRKIKQKGLRIQISHFYWSFSSGIMAVKGLMPHYRVLYNYLVPKKDFAWGDCPTCLCRPRWVAASPSPPERRRRETRRRRPSLGTRFSGTGAGTGIQCCSLVAPAELQDKPDTLGRGCSNRKSFTFQAEVAATGQTWHFRQRLQQQDKLYTSGRGGSNRTNLTLQAEVAATGHTWHFRKRSQQWTNLTLQAEVAATGQVLHLRQRLYRIAMQQQDKFYTSDRGCSNRKIFTLQAEVATIE